MIGYVHLFFDTPIKAYALENVFYNEDRTKKDIVEVKLLGLSSYEGEAITFITEITDTSKLCRKGSLFFCVPPNKVSVSESFNYKLMDLVYENCPSYGKVCLTKIRHLDYCNVFMKHKKLWVEGKPLYFIDWVDDNVLLIMVKLNNGQFAFIPPHKIKFSEVKELCDFKKMRKIWKV